MYLHFLKKKLQIDRSIHLFTHCHLTSASKNKYLSIIEYYGDNLLIVIFNLDFTVPAITAILNYEVESPVWYRLQRELNWHKKTQLKLTSSYCKLVADIVNQQ